MALRTNAFEIASMTASARAIVYAAAAQSAKGVPTRFLMRDVVSWQNDAPFVNDPGHRPSGL